MAKETKDSKQTKAKSRKKVATTAKKTTTKKATTVKKAVAKKTTTRKKSATSKTSKFKSEYYDLPYMYNKTLVRVLAQTPKMLFIYWEIAEQDRENLKQNFGEDFFEKTRPVLIVYNDTMHYSFEVDINDFANSWYLHIDDANCDYHIELGRRPYPETHSKETEDIPHYVYVTSSNEMGAPNNQMLFDSNIKTVKFRNVKTGEIRERDIRDFTFITNFGIFTIQDLYKYLYPNETFECGNTLSSSSMFSSQFK